MHRKAIKQNKIGYVLIVLILSTKLHYIHTLTDLSIFHQKRKTTLQSSQANDKTSKYVYFHYLQWSKKTLIIKLYVTHQTLQISVFYIKDIKHSMTEITTQEKQKRWQWWEVKRDLTATRAFDNKYWHSTTRVWQWQGHSMMNFSMMTMMITMMAFLQRPINTMEWSPIYTIDNMN